MSEIKAQFPIFQNHPELVYLDNAATTQKPQIVIDAMVDFYTKHNANVHRGIYPLSETATDMYEAARRNLADFIGAAPEEIIFNSGTTEGMNMIAGMLLNSGLFPGRPNVVTTDVEHHANILPWQIIANEIRYIPLNANYEIALDEMGSEFIEANFSPDIVAVSLISNVTGAILDLKQVRQKFPKAIIVADAAQAIAHMPINVKDLDVDFLLFSGHKMYGPTGIGVVYGKQELLEKLDPVKVGGGMIRKVERDSASWAPLPEKFEAGTPPIAQAIGLSAAVDFVSSVGWEKVAEIEDKLYNRMSVALEMIDGLTLYHPKTKSAGVFSFSIEGIHPHDLAHILGEKNIAIRAGHHCTQILHREVLNIPATSRASLAIYNTEQDIEKLVSEIQSAQSVFN